VIAIVAILAAILFPVFAQAKEKARQSVCLSNLKQLGTAAMLYVQDYDDTYPGGPGVAGDRHSNRQWESRIARLSYWWHWGLSQGYSWPTHPSGKATTTRQPFTLATVARPSLLQMVQDNWAAYHSVVQKGQARWNICYADGHAKFSHYIDGWAPANRQSWTWNLYNPGMPLNVERPCEQTCAQDAAAN
jgi:type II secretory pathway pseudopilin PulG